MATVTYTFRRDSILTGKSHAREITLDMKDYYKWQNGMLIQNALPYLSPEDREFLMTGITPKEWRESIG
jgi:hypothetical protein